MNKLVTLSITTLMLLGLVACAGTSANDGARVKCPACGYEFDTSERG